jgi:capsular polysaccharide biosynthesis protein
VTLKNATIASSSLPSRGLRRARNKIVRGLVESLGVPPSYLGYVYLEPVTVEQYVRECESRPGNGSATLQLLEPAGASQFPLPHNVSDREELSRESVAWGYSFYDVPTRKISKTYIATVHDCRIVSYRDEWDNEFYAIITHDDRVLSVRGTGFRPEHGRLLKKTSSVERIQKGAWILEYWSPNYFHWLLYHLPKIMILNGYGRSERIILPSTNRLYPVIERSMELLGVGTSRLPKLNTSVLHVDELTIVETDLFPSVILHQMREKVIGHNVATPNRKVFISRELARWRRLVNQEAMWEILRAAGYEKVLMEKLTLDEQVSLMSETRVIFGLHGAGLANMLFCPSGAHIIELTDPDFQEPGYYALASSLGHHYWHLKGEVAGERKAAYHDLTVNTSVAKEIVARVECAIELDRQGRTSPRVEPASIGL